MGAWRGVVLVHSPTDCKEVCSNFPHAQSAFNPCRYALERHIQGLKPIVPLTPSEFRQSLGPGYGTNGLWYQFSDLRGRMDNCNMNELNRTNVDEIEEAHRNVKNRIRNIFTDSEFGNLIQTQYHHLGHNRVGEVCSGYYNGNTPDDNNGVMAFSAVSARDPIFYRWHQHLEDLMREYRDTHYAR